MADVLPPQSIPVVPNPPTQSTDPSENAQPTAVKVPAPSELANTKRVTDFFSSSVKVTIVLVHGAFGIFVVDHAFI